MIRGSFVRGAVATAAGLTLLAGLSGCSEDRATPAETTTTAPTKEAKDCASDLLACAKESTLSAALPKQVSKASGKPIVIGMINQENTPLGSYPELSSAAKAAAALVNENFGGVNGRPIEIDVCNTKFSPEGSTACAQQFVEAGVPAVLGGIDVFGNGIDVLRDNKIPFVGGIPVSMPSVTSASSYQWSGGTWGATIAFANHAATELKAKSVAILYPEFDPITDSAERGERVLKQAGVSKVQLIPYPITATDLTSPLQAAAAAKPDALIMLAADMGCKGTFDGIDTVGIKAQVYLVGACAAPKIIAEAGPEKTEGIIFNVEGPIDPSVANIDTSLYIAAAKKYGDGFDPVGAGTVAFRSFMNLWATMVGLDEVTPKAITDALAAKKDEPSFMGHNYTCDHKQLSGLPAMCSPQQILAQLQDGKLVQLGTWVDVGTVPGA
ncbi:MAG: ABC transporter substrate-binding protein [Aquihabitans sp.]